MKKIVLQLWVSFHLNNNKWKHRKEKNDWENRCWDKIGNITDSGVHGDMCSSDWAECKCLIDRLADASRPWSYWSAQSQGQKEATNSDTDLCCLDLGLNPENCPSSFILWPLASRGAPDVTCAVCFSVLAALPCSSTNCLSQRKISRELKRKGEG